MSAPAGAGAVRLVASRIRRRPAAMVSLVFIVVITLAGVLAPVLATHDPAELASTPFQGPSGDHWFGTDESGRDVFSRILFGARLSLMASFVVVGVAVLLALVIGLVAGYFEGAVDAVLMRAMDALLSIPAIILAIALVAVLGASLRNAIIAMIVVAVPNFARLIRGQALVIRRQVFVEASELAGSSRVRIMVRRILPSILSPLIVLVSIELGTVMIVEASLSFLGLGAQPPAASWGLMLARAYSGIIAHPWQAAAPGLALIVAVLAFTTLGNELRASVRGDDLRRGRRHRAGVVRVERPAGTVPDPVPEPADTLLAVQGLHVDVETREGLVPVVEDVSFTIDRGEILGLVGESGSGKTVTSLAIMGLPSAPVRVVGGAVRFQGTDLLGLGLRDLARVRGAGIAMIFQDPQSSLNPSVSVGAQVAQAVLWHEKVGRAEAVRRARESLEQVGIAASRYRAYPHELSGGMRQRVMIAMALVTRPKLLIADEPTTALDVTIQAQILDLLRDLRRDLGMAILLVTHDLGVVADTCDRVAVMYAGQIVETAPVHDLFARAEHPYTAGLLRAVPTGARSSGPLYVIPGQVPAPGTHGEGCRFAGRCAHADDICRAAPVALTLGGPRSVRCVRTPELDLEIDLDRAIADAHEVQS